MKEIKLTYSLVLLVIQKYKLFPKRRLFQNIPWSHKFRSKNKSKREHLIGYVKREDVHFTHSLLQSSIFCFLVSANSTYSTKFDNSALKCAVLLLVRIITQNTRKIKMIWINCVFCIFMSHTFFSFNLIIFHKFNYKLKYFCQHTLSCRLTHFVLLL